ncbi:hypothetical protein R3P38DRAFT_2770275 [Favolaschia claudopus]|uniref:Uncharacterized protein n=1 Tax=Favolaschia claudopus TaxID=2862362 RepID=A0AAW0CCM7_9AGAR
MWYKLEVARAEQCDGGAEGSPSMQASANESPSVEWDARNLPGFEDLIEYPRLRFKSPLRPPPSLAAIDHDAGVVVQRVPSQFPLPTDLDGADGDTAAFGLAFPTPTLHYRHVNFTTPQNRSARCRRRAALVPSRFNPPLGSLAPPLPSLVFLSLPPFPLSTPPTSFQLANALLVYWRMRMAGLHAVRSHKQVLSRNAPRRGYVVDIDEGGVSGVSSVRGESVSRKRGGGTQSEPWQMWKGWGELGRACTG